MRWINTVVLIVVAGCSYDIPGEFRVADRYPEELEVAIAEWGGTDCDMGELRAAVLDTGEKYLDLCDNENTSGCYTVVPYPRRSVIVLHKPYMAWERNTVTHELMHWLTDCEGGDHTVHDDLDVWGEDGVLARVNDALGLPAD